MNENMIGICLFVKAFDKYATHLWEENKYKESQYYFEMSIEICENESNLLGYADLLDDMNDYETSVSFYKKAINVEDEQKSMIPHYNLGQTILSRCINLYNVNNNDAKIEKMFKESLEQFNIVFNNEKRHTIRYLRDKCVETLKSCLFDIIKLIPALQNIVITKSTSQLEIQYILEQIYNDLQNSNTMENILKNYIILWKESIEKMPDYIIYKNKKKLFEKMNYLDDCCICLEHCLQIDLHCGHTVCCDCYKKIYEEPCPICRSKCEIVD